MTAPLSDTPRWGSYTHEQIYAWVHAGPGQAASQYAQGQWSSLWFVIQLVEARLSAAIADIGSGWEGQAAAATAAGVTPLGAWALDTAEQAQRTNLALAAQASDAGHVQPAMPAPEHSALPVQPPVGIGVTRADLEDRSALDQARNEQARRAVDLMAQYSERSAGNTAGFASSPRPPRSSSAAPQPLAVVVVVVVVVVGERAGPGPPAPRRTAGSGPRRQGSAGRPPRREQWLQAPPLRALSHPCHRAPCRRAPCRRAQSLPPPVACCRPDRRAGSHRGERTRRPARAPPARARPRRHARCP